MCQRMTPLQFWYMAKPVVFSTYEQFEIFHLEISRSLHQTVQFERSLVLFRAHPNISVH